MNKGQISLLSVIAIIFAMVGMVGILGAGDIISKKVEYNVGDFNQVAAAKLKADAYEARTRKELNYSLNIVTLEQLEGKKRWSKNEIPSLSTIKSDYSSKVRTILRDELSVYRCSSPKIEKVNSSKSETGVDAEAQIVKTWLTCKSNVTNASIPVKSTIKVSNQDNSYLLLNSLAITVSEDMKSRIGSVSWEKGTGTAETGCVDNISPSLRTNTNQEAENEAESNAETHNVAENSASNLEHPTFVDIDAETNFDYSSQQTSQEIEDCTRKVYPSDCNPEDDACTPVPKDGEKYTVTYKAEVDSVTANITFRDTTRELMNSDGNMKTQNLDLVYTHTIS